MTVASTPVKTVRQADCGEDYYPPQALRLNQQGTVVMRFCVGANNKIDGPMEVLTSSGFPALDEAAGKCLAAGSYKAGNGGRQADPSVQGYQGDLQAAGALTPSAAFEAKFLVLSFSLIY